MAAQTVMICDDNSSVHNSLEAYLHEFGLNAVNVFDGETALNAIRTTTVDLMVLDLMLPGISGTEVLREIRKFSNMPVVILSAKGTEIDRVVGLEIGADDYVTKPFSPREVAIRIKKLLNRINGNCEIRKLELGEITILLDSYEIILGGSKIELTPKETEILSYLVYNAGKVISREMILSSVWGINYLGDTRCVDTHIKRLRHKLPLEDFNLLIRSIYGIGYKLEVIA